MNRIRKNAYTDFSKNTGRDKFVWTYQLSKISKKSTKKQILSTISYINYASILSL